MELAALVSALRTAESGGNPEPTDQIEAALRVKILDQYDLSSGGYLGTHVLPTRATNAVMDAHGRVFMNVFVNADADHIYPKLVALRSRPKPKGPQEGGREE